MPNNLTITNAAYVTSGAFGQALSANINGDGSATAGFPLITSVPFTVRARIMFATTGGLRVFAGQQGCFFMAVTVTGSVQCGYGVGGGTVLLDPTSIVISDNTTYHDVEFTLTSTGGKLFVDGVLAAQSSTTPVAAGCIFTNNFTAASYPGGFTYGGKLDELAIFNTVLHPTSATVGTSVFTPYTTPFAGNEAGLTNLYHFDGNGNDSVITSTTILPNDSALYFSPLNWKVTSTDATSINSGAYFRTLFTGSSCTLNFDVTGVSAPNPRIVIVVDGITYQRATLAASISVTMPTGQNNNTHLLEVYIDSTTRTANRWTVPRQTAVILTSIVIGGTASAAEQRQKTTFLLSDSIGEGVRTLSSVGSSDTDQDSAFASWALKLAAMLNSEIGIVAFASSGLTVNGTNNVPTMPNFWDKLWSGENRVFSTSPDYCIWMIGTNDGTTNTVSVGISTLNAQLAAMPNTQFIILRPFNGTAQAANLQAIVAGCSDVKRVSYIDTNGFWSAADSSDALHPYGYAGDKIARKVRKAIQPLIDKTKSGSLIYTSNGLGIKL